MADAPQMPVQGPLGRLPNPCLLLGANRAEQGLPSLSEYSTPGGERDEATPLLRALERLLPPPLGQASGFTRLLLWLHSPVSFGHACWPPVGSLQCSFLRLDAHNLPPTTFMILPKCHLLTEAFGPRPPCLNSHHHILYLLLGFHLSNHHLPIHPSFHLFIHSLNKHSVSPNYVPGPVLGAGEPAGNETGGALACTGPRRWENRCCYSDKHELATAKRTMK